MNEKGERRPIDRPCSACSAGDTKMEYHLHQPPFREMSEKDAPKEPREWLFINRGHQFVYEYGSSEIYNAMSEYTSALRSELADAQRMIEWCKGQHVSGVELLKDAQKGLQAAKHFFDSPRSFSDSEFQGIAEQVYKAIDGKPCTYTGTVPYLHEYADAQKEVERLTERLRSADAYFPTAALEKVNAEQRSEAAEKEVERLKAEAKKVDAAIIEEGILSQQREQTMRQALTEILPYADDKHHPCWPGFGLDACDRCKSVAKAAALLHTEEPQK